MTVSPTNPVRTRFAPSPTGLLNLGNLRTALFTYLFAKKNQGIFIVRFEDTDDERSKKEFEENILWSLKWIGIECDEGPDIGGLYGPYRQSERLNIYENYLKRLLKEDKAYYCFCSLEEIEIQRQYQLSIGEAPRYLGKCRNITLDEAEKKIKKGETAVIRFKNPQNKKIVFEDIIRGKIEFDSALIGDFVIARNLRSPLFNFSNVVDDYEMKITHVIRGEEHISNTPNQILIQEALGFSPLKYAHLPMVLAPDKSKWSKRHGAVPILNYEQEGYLPEALVNFMVLLGWHPEDDREIFSLKSLIKEFSLERVQKSGAVFNQPRLDWFNGFYIRNLSPNNLAEKCLPYLIKNNLIKIVKESAPLQLIPAAIKEPWKEQEYEIVETKEVISFDYLTKIISLSQPRLKKISEIADLTDFFFKELSSLTLELLRWKQMPNEEIKESLEKLKKILEKVKPEDWQKQNLENILVPEAEKTGPKVQQADFGARDRGDRGYLLWPLRVALTGKEVSAGPFEIADVLGKEKTIKRIKEAIKITKLP